MASEKQVNYTAEQVAQAVADYQAGVTVEAIAEALGKSARSVVAKLSREGVYVAKAKTKADARLTKEVLVKQIAEVLSLDVKVIHTFEKATHEALEAVYNAIKG